MSLVEYIRQQQEQSVFVEQQRQLKEERQRAVEEEAARVAEEEAARVAKMEADAREQAENVARKKLLRERQETERLRQKHAQRKAKLREQKWNKQSDTLLTQIDRRRREDDKLEEIRIIIQNRESPLQGLGWASWLLSDPLNQRLADLDYDLAVEMFKRDNMLAKRRRGGRKNRYQYHVLSFTGDTAAGARRDYVSTAFDPQTYSLNNGFTWSFWVRPDEIPVATHLFAFGKRNANAKERFVFGLQNASKLYLGVGKQKKTSSNHGMTVDNWYHWVITFAGGTGGALIAYRNGEDIDLAADGNGTSTWVDTVGGIPIHFGARNLWNSPYDNGWACALSQVAIFDEVKDADWVTDVYDAGRRGTHFTGQSGLVGYWKFNEGGGTTVIDHSGNGNNGALASDTDAGGSGTPSWGMDVS
tara:strand:+ start:49 stop:1296 length:1248 start_codon:yes stop_codon:yes gene_type:complete